MGKKDIETLEVDDNDGFVEQPRAGIWTPHGVGDLIEGHLMEIKQGQYGPVYMIRPSGEPDAIALPNHQTLLSRMTKAKPGDTIRVVYQGEEPPTIKGRNPTQMYKVFIKE